MKRLLDEQQKTAKNYKYSETAIRTELDKKDNELKDLIQEHEKAKSDYRLYRDQNKEEKDKLKESLESNAHLREKIT
jgi:hypothetical protein